MPNPRFHTDGAPRTVDSGGNRSLAKRNEHRPTGNGGIVIRKIMEWLLAITLLAAIVLVLWRGVVYVTSLKSEVAAAILAASIAGAVSIVSLAASKAYETRTLIAQDIRAKKTPAYEEIANMLFRLQGSGLPGGTQVEEAEVNDWFVRTTERVAIWGSDEMIRAYGRFKRTTWEGEPIGALFAVEDLVLAIRRDLGHSDQLERGSILRMFITDVDNYL